jgi:uroporphyrinogen decarboxylase
MTPRENVLSLYRRQGYPHAPAQFGLCPSLQKKYKEVAGATPLKAGTTFDAYGVAHEPGSEAAKHMTYMRHPLARATSLEEMQAYPFPEFDTHHTDHMRQAVARLHAEGKAAVGGMQCTIWETARQTP